MKLLIGYLLKGIGLEVITSSISCDKDRCYSVADTIDPLFFYWQHGFYLLELSLEAEKIQNIVPFITLKVLGDATKCRSTRWKVNRFLDCICFGNDIKPLCSLFDLYMLTRGLFD